MGRTALHEAVLKREGALVEFLLGHGGGRIINVQDSTGKTPLHWAVPECMADEETIRLLCHHCADMEVTDNIRNTPMSLAIDRGGVLLARALLGCMANVPDRKAICKT